MKFDQKFIAKAGFSLFFGWIMCLPYEGPLLYAFAENRNVDGTIINLLSVFGQFFGILLGGFLVKTTEKAKRLMLTAVSICLTVTLLFPLLPTSLWIVIVPITSFIAGLYVSSFGFFYNKTCEINDRLKFAADLLIYGNVVLVLVHILTTNISPYAGWTVVSIVLILSLVLTRCLEVDTQQTMNLTLEESLTEDFNKIWRKALGVLCFFIFIITINSGLMFQVIYPAFGEYEVISSFYTNIPYILIIVILRFLPAKMNKSYILYIGMALLGLAYIAFISLNISITSYFIVITLMLSCCGIFDLFWWSTLGDMFQYTKNPALVFGMGLSMNVFGVWCGGMIGVYVLSATGQARFGASIVALVILLAVLLILPILNSRLSRLLDDNTFLMTLYNAKKEGGIDSEISIDTEILTDREKDIALLLVKGYTYKAIAEELYITENTTKTHVRNIYSKMNVQSKMELIRLFAKNV